MSSPLSSTQVHARPRPSRFADYFNQQLRSRYAFPPSKLEVFGLFWRHLLAWLVAVLAFYLFYYVIGLVTLKTILGTGFGVSHEDAIAVMLIGCLVLSGFFAAVVFLALLTTMFNILFCGKGTGALRR